jgi:hypothetical protein
MPRGGRTTTQERIFVKTYVETQNGVIAAEKAGYAQPATSASKNLAKPALLAEIQRQQSERLINEVLPLAVGRHVALLKDPNTVGASLNKAIELAYKYGLAKADAADGREPHEMTAAELAKAIDTLENVAAQRAKLVEPEPGVLD